MTAEAGLTDRAFKRAIVASAVGHTILFAFIVINPALPKKPSPKGVIHYMSMSRIGGGGGRPAGGGAGGGVKTEAQKPPAKKESLRDLTTPDKVKPKAESKLRYPVDDKTKRKSTPEKKATVSKPGPESKEGTTGGAAATAGRIGSGGSGLSLAAGGTGTGEGGFGFGFGEGGFGDGLAEFPYAYYLQRVQDEISVNWFPKSIDPGPDVILQTVVYFRIYRNGSISTIEIKQSSGLPNFDMIAQRAVANAAPFPPLPDDYEEEYFGINLLFEHAR